MFETLPNLLNTFKLSFIILFLLKLNAPVEMSNFTSNLDVCLDITNQAGLSDFATPGQAVTLHTISTNMATVVDSCFSTGADARG